MESNNPHLKLVGADLRGWHTKMFWVDEDGNETDISRVFTKAFITIDVKGANTVQLTAFLDEFEAVGIPELVELIERE